MTALYNEIEPYAAQWLRNLEGKNFIAPGNVTEEDIRAIAPERLEGITQAHFFAGIGVWSYALRLAGWPDDAPVWTGSCPCQPFSTAGRRKGTSDERHLWPTWFDLIRTCRPPVVFGEQVASPDGLAWFDAVSSDLEGAGYTVGAADLCAAGVGAPHLRQRLYFVAYTDDDQRHESEGSDGSSYFGSSQRRSELWSSGHSKSGRVAHHQGRQLLLGATRLHDQGSRRDDALRRSETGVVGDASLHGARQHARQLPRDEAQYALRTEDGDHASVTPGATGGFWADAEWLPCRDSKHRPVEPGTFPLAHGAPARVGRLRAYGNAIVAPLAAAFIRAAVESINEPRQHV